MQLPIAIFLTYLNASSDTVIIVRHVPDSSMFVGSTTDTFTSFQLTSFIDTIQYVLYGYDGKCEFLKNENNRNSTKVLIDLLNDKSDTLIEKVPCEKTKGVFFDCGSQSECLDTVIIRKEADKCSTKVVITAKKQGAYVSTIEKYPWDTAMNALFDSRALSEYIDTLTF